jgi:AraC-like DNA-binding protein
MVIMVIEISDFLSRVEASQYSIFTQKFHFSVSKTLKKFNGNIEKKDNNNYLVTYQSVTDAVQCALKIQYKFKYVTPKHTSFSRRLKIALSISKTLNKQAIKFATRMCEMVRGPLVISAKVKNLYESANENAEIDNQLIHVLNTEEEKFLSDVMDYVEINWLQTDFNVKSFSKALGYTYAQLYGRLMKLTGKSPNNFMREFRLHKALILLHNQRGSIAQIATQTGFNSPTYFSKCFLNKYGIRPSKYMQQHT